MTNISKSHKLFSERLQDPRVLTNPEEFLGPNYRAVLNFWLFIQDLTKDQCMTIYFRERGFYFNQHPEWNRAAIEAHDASNETIGSEFAEYADVSAWAVYGNAARWATRELIGMHKILNQNNSLTFFQMFLKDL